MNEITKGIAALCTTTSRHSYEGRGGGYDIEYFDKEKFAELIVKDILTVVAAHALANDSALTAFINLKQIYEKL